MSLKRVLNIALVFGLMQFGVVVSKKGALLETAEALLAVAQQNEGYGSCDYPEHYFCDFDDAKNISQTIMIDREVNRDVFTSMLVETERDAFLKYAAQAEALLKKWTEVEKALVDGKSDSSVSNSAVASSSTSSALVSAAVNTPAATESKPASSLSMLLKKSEEKKEEPAKLAEPEKKPEEAKPLFDAKTDDASGRKPGDIKPPSFLDRFKKKQEEAKAEAKPADSSAPAPTSPVVSTPAADSAAPAATAEAKPADAPKPEEKKDEAKPADATAAAKPEESKDDANPLRRSRRLRSLGRK